MKRRGALLPVLALAHLSVLAGLWSIAPATAARRAATGMTMFAVAAPAPTPIEMPPPETPVAASVDAPQFQVQDAVSVTATTGDCGLIDSIRTGLQDDAAVRSAVERVPAAARSVANAMMLWDGRWVAPATVGGPAALDPIRQVVVDRIRAAPPGCGAAPVNGPRMIIVPGGGRSVVLAFGSGTWAWSQLTEQ